MKFRTRILDIDSENKENPEIKTSRKTSSRRDSANWIEKIQRYDELITEMDTLKEKVEIIILIFNNGYDLGNQEGC